MKKREAFTKEFKLEAVRLLVEGKNHQLILPKS